jgi:hypothetical protein
MNLNWNAARQYFEAEFSSDFQGDLAAVKAVGFKTSGPPSWVWYSIKAEPLNKLRENRPASGLTITAEAKAQFAALHALEVSNAKVKAELAEHTKALKKKLKAEEEQVTHAVHIPPKGYIGTSDLPPLLSVCKQFIPPDKPTTLCIICADPIYFYEKQDPPTCLWCEKIVLDNSTEVC